MLAKIFEHLLRFQQEDTRVLYAVEAGSRLWRMESPDSDYDVRVIYQRPRAEYLRLRPPVDHFKHQDGLIDLAGWDLRKTLLLAHNSNPALLEWLSAPPECVYVETDPAIGELRRYLGETFSRRKVLLAYLNLAKNTLKSYFSDDDAPVPLKKYFYVLRPLFAAQWMFDHDFALPPVSIETLFQEVSLTGSQVEQFTTLLAKKRAAAEAATDVRCPALDQFVADTLQAAPVLAEALDDTGPDIEVLDDLYRRALA